MYAKNKQNPKKLEQKILDIGTIKNSHLGYHNIPGINKYTNIFSDHSII